MKNREVYGLQGASQNVGLQKLQEVLFISNFNLLPSQWCARSQVCALECRPKCARAHLIAQNVHGAAGKVMARAKRVSRAYVACARS